MKHQGKRTSPFVRPRIVLFASLLVGLILAPIPAAQADPSDPAADRLFGQANFSNSSYTTSVLDTPGDAALDSSGRIYIADSYNRRIASWASATASWNPATQFAGSPDLTITDSGTLPMKPVSAALDSSGNLYVADKDNNRILVYEVPFSGTSSPSRVVGQASFNAGGGNQGGLGGNTLNNPLGVTLDKTNHLYVADSLNNRVLQFTTPITPTSNAMASLVFGQADFVHNLANRGGAPAPNTLNLPQGVSVDESGNLYVADTDNHRVLVYKPPFSNGMAASIVIGQADFTSNSANRGLGQPSAQTLNYPVGLASDSYGHLFVADQNNHRVVGYNIPLRTGMLASRLFGQVDFATATVQYVQTASTLYSPNGLAVNQSGDLFVTDIAAHRVLGYQGAFFFGVYEPFIRKR